RPPPGHAPPPHDHPRPRPDRAVTGSALRRAAERGRAPAVAQRIVTTAGVEHVALLVVPSPADEPRSRPNRRMVEPDGWLSGLAQLGPSIGHGVVTEVLLVTAIEDHLVAGPGRRPVYTAGSVGDGQRAPRI